MKAQPFPWRRLIGAGLIGLAPLAATMAQAQLAPPQAPEAATGRTAKQAGTATKDMVAAANPLAAEAGRQILAAGGSAVDAAITVQLVLTLVEPQSSGIGGGAFLVHWDGQAVTTLDGREVAPAAAKPERFLTTDGQPMKFNDAVVGGRSVGVPGVVRMLETAHRRWGKLPWKQLFEPAIKLADEGFTISPRLGGLVAQDQFLATNPVAKAYFYEADGKPKAIGSVLKNPDLARTLRAIADNGSAAFYTGEIAQDIVATVTSHPTNPGDMTLDDLKAYKVEEREPVCGPYRAYRLCGMAPPSSGGIGVLQILGMLEGIDLAAMKPGPDAVHWIAEAGRLAYADRALFLADPQFVSVPVRGLIDRDYIKSRAALMSPDKSMGKAQPGNPPFQRTFHWGGSEGIEFGTSHIAIVDRDGRAVSMTTTIEGGFGSRQMTKGGFLLNNQLTDFSFATTEDGKPVANRVEPGKRPRSTMAPMIVLDGSNKLYAVVGSPGGSAIINYVTKTLVGILDWKLDPQVAVDLPNIGSRNAATELEKGTEAEGWKAALEAKGHPVQVIEQTSGIQALVVTPTGLVGGADSRREGVAIGN
ncbi:MAG TPA: gamma-glutamyltransferase [Microvirga sp.]|jgi:gamma-glutamyltranspeptidase/glutathione hydrolase